MLGARALGQPPLYGLIVGLLFAGLASSAGLYVWLRASLNRLAEAT